MSGNRWYRDKQLVNVVIISIFHFASEIEMTIEREDGY